MRCRIARLLNRMAERLDPQPPAMPFDQAKFLADVLSGQLGRSIVGRGFEPGSGTEFRY